MPCAKKMIRKLILLVLAMGGSSYAQAEFSVRQVFRQDVPRTVVRNIHAVQPIDEAAWVWHPDFEQWGDAVQAIDAWKDVRRFEPGSFFRFRRSFVSDGSLLRLDVSADERFVLLLDGRIVARGPHCGDVDHWQYATYEIGGLSVGTHVMEAVCWQLGCSAPLAWMSWRGGFVLKAEGRYDASLTTGRASWSVAKLKNTRMVGKGDSETFGVGSECEVRGTSFLNEEPDADEWREATAVRRPIEGNRFGGRVNGWSLYQTLCPDQMSERKTPGRIVNSNMNVSESFSVPANTELELIWDLEDYYCAYPEAIVSGGDGTRVSWSWAESLRTESGGKDRRDVWEGLKFSKAFTDVFHCDGRTNAVFSTPWWRCGRWCRIVVKTGNSPVEALRLVLVETRYPLKIEGVFSSNDERLVPIWNICCRAQEMCSHEMLFDCPYYEQQMYPGDMRVQNLNLAVLSADERLSRFALEAFQWSQRVNGLVAMNYPSRGTQESATYTLCWLLAIRDALMYRGDVSWIKTILSNMRHAIDGIAMYENASGLIASLPGWNYVDSAFSGGVPPVGTNGEIPSASINLFYLLALQGQVDMERAQGDPALADHYERRAESLARAIVSAFWNDERGLIAENPGGDLFSEHAQALAVLSGLVKGERHQRLVEGLLTDASLVRCTAYFTHYLFEAYYVANQASRILEGLGPWHEYVRLGSCTTFETKSTKCRSDCHAWSASPAYHFISSICGIRPASPSFRTVSVRPSPGALKHLEAHVPHPGGAIEFSLDVGKDGGCRSSVVLPSGVSGFFYWGSQPCKLSSGRNDLCFD